MSAPFPAQWIRGAGRRSPVPHPHLQAGPVPLPGEAQQPRPCHGYPPARPQALFKGSAHQPHTDTPLNLCTRRLEETQTHRDHGPHRYGAKRGKGSGDRNTAQNQPGLLLRGLVGGHATDP